MRCRFCGRRVRGEYSQIKTRTGGKVHYHYAEDGPYKNCHAAARHFGSRHGLSVTLFRTSEPSAPGEVAS